MIELQNTCLYLHDLREVLEHLQFLLFQFVELGGACTILALFAGLAAVTPVDTILLLRATVPDSLL